MQLGPVVTESPPKEHVFWSHTVLALVWTNVGPVGAASILRVHYQNRCKQCSLWASEMFLFLSSSGVKLKLRSPADC